MYEIKKYKKMKLKEWKGTQQMPCPHVDHRLPVAKQELKGIEEEGRKENVQHKCLFSVLVQGEHQRYGHLLRHCVK